MDSYFELKAIPDPELLQSEILAQLMQGVHGLLPQYEGRVGIGFPGYGQSRTLGGIIRLHGNTNDLNKLHSQIINDPVIRSYSLVTDVQAIPEKVKEHVIFKRLHLKGKSDIRRLVERHRERGTLTDELETAISQRYSQRIFYPHVKLKSYSTGQASFMLFVKKSVRKTSSESKLFSAYGLSKQGSTIPLF